MGTITWIYEYYIINFNFIQSICERNIIELEYGDRIVYSET